MEALLEALEALSLEGRLLSKRKRAAKRKDTAKTVLTHSRTLRPATTRHPHTATATAMDTPSTNRHNTQAVGVVRNTLVRSETVVVGLIATNKGSRPLATVALADTSVMKSAASNMVMSGVPTRPVKVLTDQDNTTQKRKSDVVRENVGVTPALVPVDMSTAVKRAAVDRPSVIPAVTVRSTATARSQDMAVASRTMAVKNRTALVDTVVRRSRAMVVNKSQAMVAKRTTAVLMDRATASRATAVKSLIPPVDMAALEAKNTVVSDLSSRTVLRESLEALVEKMSMERGGTSLALTDMAVAAVAMEDLADMARRGTEGDTKYDVLQVGCSMLRCCA